MAALALLAVLVVIGALAAPNLLGGRAEEGAGSGNAGQNNAQGGSEVQADGQSGGGSGENQGSGGDQQGTPSSASASASATPEQGGLTAQGAEETLQRVYTTAANEEFGTSYSLLSQRFKTNEGVTEAEWANTFADLQSIRFVVGPNARVSGNTATVEGVTIAENADRTERNTVTWRMVKEGGGWKLDGIPSFQQEPVSG